MLTLDRLQNDMDDVVTVSRSQAHHIINNKLCIIRGVAELMTPADVNDAKRREIIIREVDALVKQVQELFASSASSEAAQCEKVGNGE